MPGFKHRTCPNCCWEVTMIWQSKNHLRCPMCAFNVEITDGEKEGLKYLLQTWYKLRKYNMKSTGVPDFDRQVREVYGDWLTNSKPYSP